MAVRVIPKTELKLRSGRVIRPGQEVNIPTDEAWMLYIHGLIEVVSDRRQVEFAVKQPLERR